MGARYRTNEAGITELLEGAPAKRIVHDAAQDVATAAAELAPRRTGRLARSYRASRAVADHSRVYAVAYTAQWYGHLVEWGTARTTPQAPLRRAVLRAGLRLRPAPKEA